jgi:hypothetical protein
MAQWGRNDKSVTVTTVTTKETSNGAPIGTYALVKAGGGANAHQGNTNGTRANTDKNMFGNTTVGAFIPGVAKGIFGVDATEVNINGGPLVQGTVINAGSGYAANATITLTNGGGGINGVANAFANNTTLAGKITQVNISTAGSGYKISPIVSIAAPAAITIVANTNGVVAATDFLKVATANSIWQAGDRFYYAVATGNTAIAGMTGNTYYYVNFANTTGIVPSATKGGANVNITEARVDATAETGHTIRGETATGAVSVGGGDNKGVAHAGWVLRTEGTGGRAGRVQYETLVAMGSLGATNAKYGTAAGTADASDDTVLPDA